MRPLLRVTALPFPLPDLPLELISGFHWLSPGAEGAGQGRGQQLPSDPVHLPVSHYPSQRPALCLANGTLAPESVGWEWGSVRGRVLSAGLAETICLVLDVFPP